MLIIDLLLNMSILVFLMYLAYDVHQSKAEHVEHTDSAEHVADLSPQEIDRLERDDSFDERIKRIKNELAMEQNVMKHGITAEEGHPLVKNLPHNIIPDKNELPDVEYTD